MFHIARRLAAAVESWPQDEKCPPWSVDVEYNLWHPDDLQVVENLRHKHLLLQSRQLAESGEDQGSDVLPDIVVHRRTGLSPQNDLLVAEVKKAERLGRPIRLHRQFDVEKLEAFMQPPFSYRHAVFLVLPLGGGIPSWSWIIGGSPAGAGSSGGHQHL